MKKIFVIIATLALVFMSCDSGDIIGGRYFGTFHNTNNNMLEAGGLSFTYNGLRLHGSHHKHGCRSRIQGQLRENQTHLHHQHRQNGECGLYRMLRINPSIETWYAAFLFGRFLFVGAFGIIRFHERIYQKA